jgi:hypothetical protein
MIDPATLWSKVHSAGELWKELARVAFRFVSIGSSTANIEWLLDVQRHIQRDTATNNQPALSMRA